MHMQGVNMMIQGQKSVILSGVVSLIIYCGLVPAQEADPVVKWTTKLSPEYTYRPNITFEFVSFCRQHDDGPGKGPGAHSEWGQAWSVDELLDSGTEGRFHSQSGSVVGCAVLANYPWVGELLRVTKGLALVQAESLPFAGNLKGRPAGVKLE
jgi:hypothetical protein